MKLIRFLLFPFAVLYDLITSIRNLFFSTGIFKSKSFEIPVIAVGNLSVGGTGKTPQIEYLIRLLKDSYKIATLSRGYKRKTKGFQILKETHTAEDVGDEPLQFFLKFKEITVAVDANRTQGIKKLQELIQPEVVLLDDAFQHRKVKADLYILLTKYDNLYANDFLLPTGNLRESRRGAKRAEIVIVTKCPEILLEKEKQRIKERLKIQPNQKLYFTKIVYNTTLKGTNEVALSTFKKKKVILVTGIANPNPLLRFLESKEIEYKHIKFPDHHNFSLNEIEEIKQELTKSNESDTIILTTEKDYVRLKGKLEKLYYLEIETKFLEGEKPFKATILNVIDIKN